MTRGFGLDGWIRLLHGGFGLTPVGLDSSPDALVSIYSASLNF